MRRLAPLLVLCAAAFPASAGARVIAIASGDANLTLADVSTSKVINKVPIGGQTVAVARAPDGVRAYVASGRRIVAVDLSTQAVAGTGTAGAAIQGLAISADGARLYAARKGGIDVVDAHSLQPAGSIPLASQAPAGRIAVSTDGTRAVVVLDDKH